MDNSEQIQDLLKKVNAIVSIRPEDLVRTDELGSTMDFSGEVGLFKEIINLFSRLQGSDLTVATVNQINRLDQVAETVFGALNQVREFTTDVSDPAGDRRQRIEHLQSQYDTTKQRVVEIVALSFAWSGGIDLEESRQKIRDAMDELRASTESAKSILQSSLDDAESTVRAIKGKSADLGITEQALVFEGASEDFGKEKAKWLTRIVWIASGAFVVSVVNAGWVLWAISRVSAAGEGISTGEAIQIAVAKLVLFSFAYYVLVWVVRMYRAAAHNEVVTQHRALALRTFDKFTSGTTDEQTKQAVLIRTTESIFGHRASGFSGSGSDSSSTDRLMEIIRGVPRSDGDK